MEIITIVHLWVTTVHIPSPCRIHFHTFEGLPFLALAGSPGCCHLNYSIYQRCSLGIDTWAELHALEIFGARYPPHTLHSDERDRMTAVDIPVQKGQGGGHIAGTDLSASNPIWHVTQEA